MIFYFVFTKKFVAQRRIEKDNMMEGIIKWNSNKKWMKNFIINKVTNFYFYVQFLFWFFNLKFSLQIWKWIYATLNFDILGQKIKNLVKSAKKDMCYSIFDFLFFKRKQKNLGIQ